MKSLFRASLSLALVALFAASAPAADLPEVRASASNKVPQCATPERLTAYLKSRNPRVDPRYEDIAALYRQHGEALGIRWDIAYFQMILETGALRYTGDVRPGQNNFAGLGASGGGARGESFPDISTGVKAHLQHLMMYAGVHVDDPVAERTRKVQEWGVLTDWQKSIEGPMTYALVAKQWAPTSRNYVRDVSAITDGFYAAYCDGASPTQEASNETPTAEPSATVATLAPPASNDDVTTKGAEIAKRNIDEQRKQGGSLQGLGAGMLASTVAPEKTSDNKPVEDTPPVTLLNAKADAEPAAAAKAPPAKTADASKSKIKADTKATAKAAPSADKAKGANVQTASIGSAATQLKVPPAKGGKCKVFTASYGGQKAVIIKANGDGQTNYTVLDVTDGNEKREVDAYIAAYAKGGEKMDSFATQTKALTRAFELCPEG